MPNGNYPSAGRQLQCLQIGKVLRLQLSSLWFLFEIQYSHLFKGQTEIILLRLNRNYPSAGMQLQCLQIGKVLSLQLSSKLNSGMKLMVFTWNLYMVCFIK